MKLYHLTPKRIYEEHIKQEGLIPQPTNPDWDAAVPDSAVFCWPKYNNTMIKDWVVFNKLKNKNQYNDYVLLQIKVPRKNILHKLPNGDTLDLFHTLSIDVTGSHGKTEYVPHNHIPMKLVTEPVPPENITPILNISTYRAEAIE